MPSRQRSEDLANAARAMGRVYSTINRRSRDCPWLIVGVHVECGIHFRTNINARSRPSIMPARNRSDTFPLFRLTLGCSMASCHKSTTRHHSNSPVELPVTASHGIKTAGSRSSSRSRVDMERQQRCCCLFSAAGRMTRSGRGSGFEKPLRSWTTAQTMSPGWYLLFDTSPPALRLNH